MAAVYLPHENIGGDYYDCIILNENEVLYCVADVSGKGVPAALLMSNVQAYLRTLAMVHTDLTTLIKTLNDKIFISTKGERFITMFIGRYNTVTKELAYVNAGHNPPIAIIDNQITLLQTGCMLLGIFDTLPVINTGKITLSKDSLLVNFTDGITEAQNDEKSYDEDMLGAFALENKELAPEVFNQKLMEELNQYKSNGRFSDDITLLTIKTA